VLATIGLLLLPATVGAHLLDHAPQTFNEPPPPSPAFMSGGEDADWELVATLPTGNPLTDLDFFTNAGVTYASVGSLGIGPNSAGQNIVRLTNEEHLSSENEIRYTYNVGHITDEFRRTQYLSHDEWQGLAARLDALPYRHTIAMPPPGAEELDIGSANYHDIPISPTFTGPKIEPPLSLRARMDGVVMIVDHESAWAMDILAIDDPPAFFYDFAREVCAKAAEPMATADLAAD